jgi:hypothetical protein
VVTNPELSDLAYIRKRMDEIAAERTRALRVGCIECSGSGWVTHTNGYVAGCPTCKNPDGKPKPWIG